MARRARTWTSTCVVRESAMVPETSYLQPLGTRFVSPGDHALLTSGILAWMALHYTMYVMTQRSVLIGDCFLVVGPELAQY